MKLFSLFVIVIVSNACKEKTKEREELKKERWEENMLSKKMEIYNKNNSVSCIEISSAFKIQLRSKLPISHKA